MSRYTLRCYVLLKFMTNYGLYLSDSVQSNFFVFNLKFEVSSKLF